MAEPTLSLTFEDFIVRVADHLALAAYDSAGVIAVPTNAHDLEQCKRLVNDGYRKFFIANPDWNWTKQDFTITFDPDGTSDKVVAGENWRYFMPDGFYGIMLGPMTYGDNSGYMDLVEVPEHKIRSMYATSDTSGTPNSYAIRPLADDNKRRWEMIIWPKPTADHTITGRTQIYPNKLVSLTDVCNCGPQFDEAVLAAALSEAERTKDDAQALMETQFGQAMERAIRLDHRTSPKRLGDYGGQNQMRYRPYSGVDTYTNYPGTSSEVVHNFDL